MYDVSNGPGLQKALDDLGGWAAVSRATGVGTTTLQARGNRWGCTSPHARAKIAQTETRDAANITRAYAERSGVTVDGDTATIIVDPSSPWQPDELLRNHGLNPDEWLVTNARPNTWQALATEGRIVDLHQLKVEAVRRIPADLVLPARADGWKPTRRAARAKRATRLISVVSDTHAPYHDEGLHDCHLQWLEKHRPDDEWDLGDLLDLPTPSRHRTTRGFDASPQECIDTRYQVDRDRVAASPNTRRRALLGNHDVRIEHAILDKIGSHVARIARAGDTLPVMDLGFLLRYDELGIELIRPEGEYFSVTVEIAPGLHGRHGTKTSGKHGGSVKTIERRTTSMMQGHAHKAVSHLHTRYDDAGIARDLWTLDVPTMARRDIASSYHEDGDVAQGFWTIHQHADGSWHPHLARYDEASQTLYWHDEAYQPR